MRIHLTDLSDKMLAVAELSPSTATHQLRIQRADHIITVTHVLTGPTSRKEVTDCTWTVLSSERIYGFRATFQHYFSSCAKG